MGYGTGQRGRPRKEGERYPSGKLKPAPQPPPPSPSEISGASWQRMMANYAKVFDDPTFATELTRLGATGKLTPREVSIGLRIAGIYGRFEYYQQVSRSAASPSYIREFVSEGIGGEADALNFSSVVNGSELGKVFDVDDREAREREATRAFKELQAILPRACRAEVEALCVENVHIGYQQFQAARAALAIVSDGLPDKTTGLSKKQKRARRKRIRPQLAEPTKAKPIKLNPRKTAFFAFQRKLSPHLDDTQLELAWETLIALESRENFRQEKSERGST